MLSKMIFPFDWLAISEPHDLQMIFFGWFGWLGIWLV
jgi:hypothetical protein